jgi:uncharacterized membrane protein YcaP (DUF421 family)
MNIPIMPVDWAAMFKPTMSLPELFLRGSAMYLAIFAFMRLFNRQRGALNAADFLVIVLVADAAQNAISADYRSITEGIVIVATIFMWDIALDALSFRSKWFHRLLNGAPVSLVEDGRLNWRHMRREMLTKDDVLEQLREQGIDDVSEVRRCFLETDGHMSVVKYDKGDDAPPVRGTRGLA